MKSRLMLAIAFLALFLAVGIIAYTLNRGSKEVIPADDVVSTVLPDGAWPSDEVRKEVIEQTDNGYQITAAYPVAYSAAVSAYFRTFVEDAITQFKADTAWSTEVDSAEAQILAIDIDYTRNKTATVDNYVFHIGSYTGGAHGLQATKTFSFTEEGQPLTIAELFTNGKDGLKTIAPYVQAALLKRDFAEKSWIEEGAAANELNYKNVIIEPTGLTFIFDPYQVAYYAAGEQRVTVPLSVFKSIANKELFTQ